MLAPLLLLLAIQAQDSVEVRSRLRDAEIRAGETTVLRVDVETRGERAQIQPFRTLPPGLELVGTRDFDQRQFSLPGGVRRFVGREFVIRARAAGQYRIPSLDVVVAGRPYTTSSTLLTVTAAPAVERGETRGSADGVLLRAWLDQDTVFVGEQVTLEVEALFSQEARLRLRRAPEYEPPSPSGFWIHDLQDPPRPASRVIGSEVYEVQTFRRAFFPLADGVYTIPPATLEYEMRRGLLYAPETHEVESPALPLVVLPVPEEGQPPEFTGAVGDFTLRARLEPSRVPAGEAAVLTVEVEGVGNVKALPPPHLPELPSIEVFPPSEEADTEAQGATIRGSKRFAWVLIPREAGEIELPPIRYPYFDPTDGRYEVAEVAELALTAEPGAIGADEAPAAAALRYVKTSPAGDDPLAFVRSPWFLAAQTLPLLLLATALVRRRARERSRGASRSALRRRLRAGLRDLEAEAAAGDADLFGAAESFARGWLGERLGLTEREAGDAASLVSAGVPEDTATALVGLIQRIAAARYAPAPPGTAARRDLVRALGRLLDRVDREAGAGRTTGGAGGAERGRGRRARSGIGAAGLLLTAAALLPVPGPVAAQESGFAEGLRLFDAGRFGAAAEAFDRYLEAHPDDAAAWYNLGTAYHRAGHRGYAAWAWLHVPRLDPRDADTRHNLRVAGVRPELVARVAPAVPLRAEEAALLAAVAWLVAGVAGASWLLLRRRWVGAVAAVAVLVALSGLATAWDADRGGRTLVVLGDAVLRAGPNLGAETLVALEPGAGLVPVSSHGAWVRARTLRGAEGWIEARETGSL